MSFFGALRLMQVAGAMTRPQIRVESGGLRPIRPEAWATWTIGAAVVEESDASEGVRVAIVVARPVLHRAGWSRRADASGSRPIWFLRPTLWPDRSDRGCSPRVGPVMSEEYPDP